MSSIQCSQSNIRPVHVVFSAGKERHKGSGRKKEEKGGEGGNVEGDSGWVGEKERRREGEGVGHEDGEGEVEERETVTLNYPTLVLQTCSGSPN